MGTLIESPLQVKNPEFRYKNNDCMALEIEVQISEGGEKLDSNSIITLRTNNIGGYGMFVVVQNDYNDEWQGPLEVGAVSIQLRGEYERQILVAALQKIGLMTVPVYGKIDRSPFDLDEE